MLKTPELCEFIAAHRDSFGVAPICRVLTEHDAKSAPRTFFAWAARPPSKRALWDAAITEVLAGYYEEDQTGRRKPEPCLSGWGETPAVPDHLTRRGETGTPEP